MTQTRRIAWPDALLLIGGALLLLAAALDTRHAAANLMLGSYFLATLGVTAGLVLAILYAFPGHDKVWLRRAATALTRALPWGAGGLLLVLVACPALYPWTAGVEHATPFRAAWLNRPFFLLRALFYLGIWLALARSAVAVTAARLAADRHELRARHRRLAVRYCYVYAVTLWLASYDWLMSLEPQWASTIYGLYAFGAAAVTVTAALIVVLLWLQGLHPAEDVMSANQRHDMGRFLFGLSCFWVYLWFSQFLLVWYVNLPEETTWFLRRLQGGWNILFYLNVVVNWLVPFLILMPAETKRSPVALGRCAWLALLGRWLDLVVLILPAVLGRPAPGLGELALALLVAGVWGKAIRPALR